MPEPSLFQLHGSLRLHFAHTSPHHRGGEHCHHHKDLMKYLVLPLHMRRQVIAAVPWLFLFADGGLSYIPTGPQRKIRLPVTLILSRRRVVLGKFFEPWPRAHLHSEAKVAQRARQQLQQADPGGSKSEEIVEQSPWRPARR